MTEQDDKAFRRALGAFATGVAVVTARAPDGEKLGLTMSSFNSVSLDPPLVLFSVDRRARSLPAMLKAGGYAVNILSHGQIDVSNLFARAGADKWASICHEDGFAAAPLIDGALAHFECAPHATHDGGDHLIFVGRVVRFSSREGDPLIFFQGGYRNVGSKDEQAPEWPLSIHY